MIVSSIASNTVQSPKAINHVRVSPFWKCLLLIGFAQLLHEALADGSGNSSSLSRLVRYKCPGMGTKEELKQDAPWWIAELKEVAVLRSSKSRKGLNITIVQPTSVERLAPLHLQCSVWPGPIAVSVYLPLDVDGKVVSTNEQYGGKSQEQAIATLAADYSTLASGRCVLDLAVYVERFPAGREHELMLGFPNNALRNKALELADTETIMLLDADFIPGPVLFNQQLNSDAELYGELRSIMAERSLIVLNSLEVNSTVETTFEEQLQAIVDAVHSNKSYMVELVEKQVLREFRPCCHQETNFTRWMIAQNMYRVYYSNRLYYEHEAKKNQHIPGLYEPYVLALKDDVPWFDERFRGYFYNKQVWFYVLWRFGFSFTVHPGAAVLHFPHPPQESRHVPRNSDVYMTRHNLFYNKVPSEFSWHAQGGYIPVRAHEPSKCRHLLKEDNLAMANT